MVAIITVSGVALAALQLLAAYRLKLSGAIPSNAALGGRGEISIEKGNLSLKSSVNGLLILSLSLAFFIVYVRVYPVNPVTKLSRATSESAVPAQGIITQQFGQYVGDGAKQSIK